MIIATIGDGLKISVYIPGKFEFWPREMNHSVVKLKTN